MQAAKNVNGSTLSHTNFTLLKNRVTHIGSICFSFLQKFYIFFFQDILVLTRPVTQNECHSYQVYRRPIPIQELVLEDLQDGDVRLGGSFRGAFRSSHKGKNTNCKIVSINKLRNYVNLVLIFKNSVLD